LALHCLGPSLTAKVAKGKADLLVGLFPGIGGLFFGAKDTETSTALYRDMLGVKAGFTGANEPKGEWDLERGDLREPPAT
jgi:hypothetical protein